MQQITNKLIEAQKYAMSIRPEKCGFPVIAEALRQSDVLTNRWTLPSCQSVYLMKEGEVVQQGIPLISGTQEIPKFDREALISAIKTDQEGKSTFEEFLHSIWKAGVVGYEVDFISRKVIYYSVNNEKYIEEYPAVEINN